MPAGVWDQPHHPLHAPGPQLHRMPASGCTGCALYKPTGTTYTDPKVYHSGNSGHGPLHMLVTLLGMSFWQVPTQPQKAAQMSSPLRALRASVTPMHTSVPQRITWNCHDLLHHSQNLSRPPRHLPNTVPGMWRPRVDSGDSTRAGSTCEVIVHSLPG